MLRLRHLSIRARLVLLVLAVMLPASGLIAWLVATEARDTRETAYASGSPNDR